MAGSAPSRPGRIAGLALAALPALPLAAIRVFADGRTPAPLAGVDAPGFAFCLFKGLSGWPCPFCGGIRATVALAGGAPVDALLWNPLVVLIHAGLLATGVLLALGLRPPWLAAGRSPAFFRAGALLLAANWAYVIAAGR